VRIKAEAANEAAESMSDPFAKQLRLMPELKELLANHPHRNALIVNAGGSSSGSGNGGAVSENGGSNLMQVRVLVCIFIYPIMPVFISYAHHVHTHNSLFLLPHRSSCNSR
jgi:hypothetical protein